MAHISPMNGGDDSNSYVKNSTLQRDGLNAAKNAMKEALTQTLDIPTLLSASSTFAVADLGCSVGPNTLFAMETIVDIVQHMCQDHYPNLEFQVFFNDITANDFNTLFASLPAGRSKYYGAGVPGSFYGQLFPSSSIHIAYTSSSLHWLSRLPVDMHDPNSPAWNSGRIHYTGAPEAVVRAYAYQFEEDMGVFFGARSEEIVSGGVMVILMPGVPQGVLTHDVGIALTFLGSILMDMVKEGLLNRDQVDTFNFPHVYPTVEQMTRVVRKNGCFEIVKMELRNARPNPEAHIDIESAILHVRAFTEGSLGNHFGSEIVDQLFIRALDLKIKFAHMLHSSGIEIGAQLFAILKRN